MDTIDSWIVPITQNLIAALVGAACARFAAAKRESIHKVMGVAASAGKKMMPMTVRVVLDAVVIAYLITLLRALVSDPEPLTREDALMIAFWLWWLLWYVMRYIVEPLAEWQKANRGASQP